MTRLRANIAIALTGAGLASVVQAQGGRPMLTDDPGTASDKGVADEGPAVFVPFQFQRSHSRGVPNCAGAQALRASVHHSEMRCDRRKHARCAQRTLRSPAEEERQSVAKTRARSDGRFCSRATLLLIGGAQRGVGTVYSPCSARGFDSIPNEFQGEATLSNGHGCTGDPFLRGGRALYVSHALAQDALGSPAPGDTP